MRHFITISFVLFVIALSLPAHAKHPARLFNEPVKLDDAGRPLYNQWERQEFEHRLRERQRKLRRQTSVNSNQSPVTPTEKTPAPMQPSKNLEPPQTNSTPAHALDYSF